MDFKNEAGAINLSVASAVVEEADMKSDYSEEI